MEQYLELNGTTTTSTQEQHLVDYLSFDEDGFDFEVL
jgi:hypothetical protein